jgi:hypothetical protein
MMLATIRIGLVFPADVAEHVQSTLTARRGQFAGKTEQEWPDIQYIHVQKEQGFDMLIANAIDVLCMPLQNAPFTFAESCPFFALMEMPVTLKTMFCHTTVFRPAEDLRLAPGTVIHVDSVATGIQLQSLNPEIEFQVVSQELMHNSSAWEENNIQAILVDHYDWEIIETSEHYHSYNLHPDEFAEKAGHGYMVFASHRESLRIMKTIHAYFHDFHVSSYTNVERMIAKHFEVFPDLVLKVRCRKDNKNFFHCKAVLIHPEKGEFVQHKISQSTHFKLADKMIQVLSDRTF